MPLSHQTSKVTCLLVHVPVPVTTRLTIGVWSGGRATCTGPNGLQRALVIVHGIGVGVGTGVLVGGIGVGVNVGVGVLVGGEDGITVGVFVGTNVAVGESVGRVVGVGVLGGIDGVVVGEGDKAAAIRFL